MIVMSHGYLWEPRYSCEKGIVGKPRYGCENHGMIVMSHGIVVRSHGMVWATVMPEEPRSCCGSAICHWRKAIVRRQTASKHYIVIPGVWRGCCCATTILVCYSVRTRRSHDPSALCVLVQRTFSIHCAFGALYVPLTVGSSPFAGRNPLYPVAKPLCILCGYKPTTGPVGWRWQKPRITNDPSPKPHCNGSCTPPPSFITNTTFPNTNGLSADHHLPRQCRPAFLFQYCPAYLFRPAGRQHWSLPFDRFHRRHTRFDHANQTLFFQFSPCLYTPASVPNAIFTPALYAFC